MHTTFTLAALLLMCLRPSQPLLAGERFTYHESIHWLYTRTGPTNYSIQAHLTDNNHKTITVGHIEFFRNEIEEIHVKRSLRGKGIGSQLMIRALKKIKQSGYEHAYWDATPLGETGTCLPFYIKLGAKFRELPERSLEALQRHHAEMEFCFDRDGDPEINLKRFNAPTFYRLN